MVLNGVEKALMGNCSVEELLVQEGFRMERVAVELNGEILPKASYATTFLGEADKLEVVSFVGGG